MSSSDHWNTTPFCKMLSWNKSTTQWWCVYAGSVMLLSSRLFLQDTPPPHPTSRESHISTCGSVVNRGLVVSVTEDLFMADCTIDHDFPSLSTFVIIHWGQIRVLYFWFGSWLSFSLPQKQETSVDFKYNRAARGFALAFAILLGLCTPALHHKTVIPL